MIPVLYQNCTNKVRRHGQQTNFIPDLVGMRNSPPGYGILHVRSSHCCCPVKGERFMIRPTRRSILSLRAGAAGAFVLPRISIGQADSVIRGGLPADAACH
jgi:hypothetical protein